MKEACVDSMLIKIETKENKKFKLILFFIKIAI